MPKYIAVPCFADFGGAGNTPGLAPSVTIYNQADGSEVRKIDFSTLNPVLWPNDTVFYQDRSVATNPCYLLVTSVRSDNSNIGQLSVYLYATADALANGPDPAVTATPLNYPPVGMAIQPGTGDAYVADYYGGIYAYTLASGYKTEVQFSSGAEVSTGAVCANLAFDKDGNLWLTSFNGMDTSTHLLTCYTQVGVANGNPAADSTKYVQFVNGDGFGAAAVVLPGATAPSPALPLSEPNGIAFDPYGNLWLANNSDDQVSQTGVTDHATVLRLSGAWIDATLSAAANQAQVKIPTTSPDATLYVPLPLAKFGNVSFDGFTLYVEDEGGKQLWTFDTSAITDMQTNPPGLVFTGSGIPTTYPGNGGITIFDTAPATLLIRDIVGDGGQTNPIPPGGIAYESPDIGTQQSPLLGGASVVVIPGGTATTDGYTLPSQSLVGDNPGYVQVRVSNLGSTPTTGTEVLQVRWAYANSGLGWPAPWDGQYLNSDNVPTGGLVGAMVLGVIPAMSDAIFEFTWSDVPNPGSYGNSGHFCLLARIEGNALYPFDMLVPEQNNVVGDTDDPLSVNVQANPTIAWRNIVVLPPPMMHRRWEIIRFLVNGANYGRRVTIAHFAIELLDREQRPYLGGGVMIVVAEGFVLERLLEAKFDDKHCQHLGGGRFQLHGIAEGLPGIRLHPGEVFSFELEFIPFQPVEDLLVRVRQYITAGGRQVLLGGQTVAVGHVEGINAPIRRIG
jgi:sugar lactone lactonase YvrE